MSTSGHLKFQGTNRATFVGETSNIMFDTTTTSLGIGVTGTDHPSSNLYITGNAYVSSNIAVGGVLTMGTVNVVARHDLEAVTALGNTTPLTVEFSNATTGIVTTGNVEVGGELTVSGNATVSSNLVVSGNVTVSSNLTVSGNVEVGTSNLFVDTVNSRVGIETDAPDATLHVVGNAYVSSDLIVSSDVRGGYDTNTTSYFGRAAVGYCGHGDAMSISHIDSNDTGGYALLQETNGATMLNSASGQSVHIRQGNVNKMTIDSSGNVGIGESSPEAKLHINSSSGRDGIAIFNPNGGTGGNLNVSAGVRGGILISNAGGGSNAADKYSSQPIILNGGGTSATNGNLRGGSIWSMWGGSQYGLAFKGASDGDAVPEGGTDPNVFITKDKVGINKKNPGYILDVHSDDAIHIEQAGNTTFETKIHGGAVFIRNPSTSSGYEHFIINNHATGNHTTSYIQFRRGNTGNGSPIGTISGNGSTISYGGQSDYRVKENIVPMPISGLDTINNLQPKRFNFIGYPDDVYDGFIAHELQEHIPMAVTGVKDEMRGRGNVVKIDDESIIVKEDVSEPDSLEEGTKWVKLSEEPVYQNADLSKIVTYLVKAVQELSEENQTLKTRLDALENAS